MNRKGKTQVSYRVPEKLTRRLRLVSEITGLSQSAIVVDGISKELRRRERQIIEDAKSSVAVERRSKPA